MTEYQKFIHQLAINRINQRFFNSDEEKMLSVFIELFNNSAKDIRIFAGKLCNESVESSTYIEALSDFIERKGVLHILLNDFEPQEAKSSNLFKRLAYYVSEKYPIHIKTTTAKPYLTMPDGEKQYVHFAIGDTGAYRLETDIKNRTAICNMNDPETADKFIKLFDTIYNDGISSNLSLAQFYNI